MAVKIDPKDKAFVVETIRRFFPNAMILAFGSRIRGDAKPYSDLDVAIDNGEVLDYATLAQLKESFAESRLAYKIDVVDLRVADSEFFALIKGYAQSW